MSNNIYRFAVACDSVLCPGDCDLCKEKDEEINEPVEESV